MEPKSSHTHTYPNTPVIPSYVHLLITVGLNQLEQLYPGRPNPIEKKRTNWDMYMDLIRGFSVPIDDKAMRGFYYRASPKEEGLCAAFDKPMDYLIVTMQEINKHFIPVIRVYANQMIRVSLPGSYKGAWVVFSMLEREPGNTITFRVIRRNTRRMPAGKCKYLQDKSIKDSTVEKIDGYTIILLY